MDFSLDRDKWKIQWNVLTFEHNGTADLFCKSRNSNVFKYHETVEQWDREGNDVIVTRTPKNNVKIIAHIQQIQEMHNTLIPPCG